MPTIEKIVVKGFASFARRTEISLGRRVTIFVGPNNTGKSRLLRAFEIVLDTISEQALNIDDINRAVIARLEESSPPEDEDIASFEATVKIDDASRERAVSDALRNWALERAPQLRRGNDLWNALSESLVEYSKILFPSSLVFSVKASRRAARDFILEGSWARFIASRSREVNVYSKRWERTFAERGVQFDGSVELLNLVEMVWRRFVTPSVRVPQTLPPVMPSNVAGSGAENPPTPENLREYYLYLSEPATRTKKYESLLTETVRLVRTVFPDIKNIVPTMDMAKRKPVVQIVKNDGIFEIGSQGDGLKQLLMSMGFMHNLANRLVIIDEPETHLHSSLEPHLVDFFLEHGQGQLVIATHSETIVGSVPEERIRNGDVVIYGLSIDSDSSTEVIRGDASGIYDFLVKLEVPISRYMKHMAALANTLLFVEGETDGRKVMKGLERFGRLEELNRYKPFFVPLGGAREAFKIGPLLVEGIAKGDMSLKTPPVSYLVILDRDESRKQMRPYEFVLSVREIENTVLSKASIERLALDVFVRLEIERNDNSPDLFERNLVDAVRDYYHKWALLLLQDRFEHSITPLLKRSSLGESVKLARDDALKLILLQRETAEKHIVAARQTLTDEGFDSELKSIGDKCLGNGKLDYEYLCQNIPGKDFIAFILPDALVRAAIQVRSAANPNLTDKRIQDIVVSMCTFEGLLQRTEVLHDDFGLLLQRLKEEASRFAGQTHL